MEFAKTQPESDERPPSAAPLPSDWAAAFDAPFGASPPLRHVDVPEPLLRVTINLRKLRENLSQAWRRRLSPQEVRDYLTRAGFREDAGGAAWLAGDSLLMRLDPSEVISAEPDAPREGRAEPSRN